MYLSLIPFYEDKEIGLSCIVDKEDEKIKLSFELTGNIESVEGLMNSYSAGDRKDELWNETCFEFFFIRKDSEQYVEMNFSPNGDWNIYEFPSYRKEMTESRFIEVAKLESFKGDSFGLEAIIDCPYEFEMIQVSAVIKKGEDVNYWALGHPNEEVADFHHPEFFISFEE